MIIQTRSWSDLSDEPLSLEAVQKIYSPAKHYRFTIDGYAAGAHFIGRLAVRATIYVMKGALVYTINNEQVRVNGGEFVELGSCDYVCDVLGDGEVKFIRVIHLPEKLRK